LFALITDMISRLDDRGQCDEIAECIEVLSGGGPGDLRELCIKLSGWMFFLGEKSASVAEGCKTAEEMIASGALVINSGR